MNLKIIGSLILIALIFGCTAPVQTDTPAGQGTLAEDIEKMKIFMQTNPGSISEEIVTGDQEFSENILKQGQFANINYMNVGTAMIQSNDGKLYLVFGDDFSTPNGPDLVVYLTSNSAPSTRADISSGTELALLKSTTGKQVYEIPSSISIDDISSVTIHCRAFNVPWSYAPLN